MNPLQLSARYLQGYGANRGIQEAVDYGLGAAIGAGGQQLMNWATQGADPNPLLSGALYAPIGAALARSGRGVGAMGREISRDFMGPSGLYSGDKRNLALLENQLTNPYTQAALAGSLAGMVGGAGTSIYNTVAGGDDIDNNTIAGGLALLGGIAPLTYSAIRNYHMRGDEIKNMDNIVDVFPPVGTSRNPVNPKTGYYGDEGYGLRERRSPTTPGSEDASVIIDEALNNIMSNRTQPRYSRNPSRIDLATGTYSRNPSRIIL